MLWCLVVDLVIILDSFNAHVEISFINHRKPSKAFDMQGILLKKTILVGVRRTWCALKFS